MSEAVSTPGTIPFPARAGMTPETRRTQSLLQVLPRTRRDGSECLNTGVCATMQRSNSWALLIVLWLRTSTARPATATAAASA